MIDSKLGREKMFVGKFQLYTYLRIITTTIIICIIPDFEAGGLQLWRLDLEAHSCLSPNSTLILNIHVFFKCVKDIFGFRELS